MQVYSQKIVRFVEEIHSFVKVILSKEVGLKCVGDRFYNRKGTYSYPLKAVVFNNKGCLGYFDSEFYEMGFHERLMHTGKDKLLSVIRHEIAHYLAFIEHGDHIMSHGAEFKEICIKYGWDDRASICLEEEESFKHESDICRKIRKLMALQNSTNKNESESALLKSSQLLLKHNIDASYLCEEEERVVLKRIYKAKRENAKMRAIALILETFLVKIVYNRTKEFTYLEIMGADVNVEIAEHMAHVLDSRLEFLWKGAKAVGDFSGKVAKNSFFLGVASGYCKKVEALKERIQLKRQKLF